MSQLTAHVAHQARLDVLTDGFPVRQHIERRYQRIVARYGEEHPQALEARQQLDGPPSPPELDYLLRWSWELYGRSGVGMDGFAPLTFTTIRDWAVLTDRVVEPHEVHALLTLDAIRRHPPKKETADG